MFAAEDRRRWRAAANDERRRDGVGGNAGVPSLVGSSGILSGCGVPGWESAGWSRLERRSV